MLFRSALVTIGVVALLLSVAGCASSSKTASSSSPAASAASVASTQSPPSSSPDLSSLQTICQQSNTRLGGAAQKAFPGGQPAASQWQPFMVQTVLPIIEQRLDALDAAPAARAPNVKAAIAAGRAAVQSARDNPSQLDPATRAPFDAYDSLMSAAGLATCGVGG